MNVCDEDVDLQSWGWTDPSSCWSSVSDSDSETGIMSRRSLCSLRLDDGLLDRSLPLGSASFSVGGSSWRNARALKSRRSQQSVSCSESVLVHTSHKPSGHSLHSVTSDASLMASILDESSIQETTVVDSFWGLDQDMDLKESTIMAEQSSVLANSTLIASDGRCPKHPVQTLTRVSCKDCESDRKESGTMNCSSKYTSATALESSTIYCRDRRRRRLGTARLDHGGAMSTKQGGHHAYGSLCRTSGGVFRWISRRWGDCPLLTWFPVGVFVVLLLLSLCCFGPAGLPPLSDPEWRTSVSEVPVLSSVFSLVSSEGAVEDSKEEATASESERLLRLERSLASLWERVEVGGRRAERRRGELLQMYFDLRQRDSAHNGHLWWRSLVDQQLTRLRRRLDDDRRQREQDLVQQQSQTSRLDHLEVDLQNVVAKTEEVRLRQEAMASPSTLPAAVGVPVDRQSHDSLLAEVGRLAAALEDIRRDVEVLSGCQDGCRRLDLVQQTISAQVHEEVRVLLYGKELTNGGGASTAHGVLPESLLRWLSERYATRADLQASLASLERSILRNISLHLDQRRSEGEVTEVREAAMHGGGLAVTREVRKAAANPTSCRFFVTAWFVWLQEVNVMVKNALRLFSHDRTGLADYALESGGGSILSTRCSETYKTRAALVSLFGLPLWYFSQSPRVVIQPDVQPGNCWAFKGSTGFLVIRLSMRIFPTAFSLEHIPKALAPSKTLRSAPRDFSVYGLDDASQERGTLLGSYTYDEDGDALQTYSVTEENDKAFQIIEVQVLSNWGHVEYTCMYRFRVHGSPCDT
uniref:SUN domain-containing protein 1-like isoform X6 n=1 Tax=Doryrhamphus excisus TaxID=161450 RepID=UPI0025ADD94A|nr:SUN domain-containing protein 1-like isoform X6 [Doryrhamphus excisus]